MSKMMPVSVELEEEKMTMKKKSGHVNYLPYDTLLDILSRVPIESVLECKLVCRKWQSLIGHKRSRFTDMHVRRQLNQFYGSCGDGGVDAGVDKPDIGLLFAGNKYGHYYVSLYYGGRYNDSFKTDEKHTYKTTLKEMKSCPIMRFETASEYLVGSCNGLICLGRYRHEIIDPIYICNPITREYINLPRFIIPKEQRDIPHIGREHCTARGFGYVRSTNEYKVVRIYYPGFETMGQAQVYTLGGGCGWRTKRTPFPWMNYSATGIFVDETIYWFDRMVGKIYAFDLAKEELRMVCTPFIVEGTYVNIGLVVLRGNLCFYYQKRVPLHMEIWSLKTTGTNGSWCRDFGINYKLHEGSDWNCFWPVMLTKNGEVVFTWNRSALDCYDPKTETWKAVVDDDRCLRLRGVRAIPHMNTLVSLRAMGGTSSRRAAIILTKKKALNDVMTGQMEWFGVDVSQALERVVERFLIFFSTLNLITNLHFLG